MKSFANSVVLSTKEMGLFVACKAIEDKSEARYICKWLSRTSNAAPVQEGLVDTSVGDESAVKTKT